MNRRQAVIAALCNAAAWFMPSARAQEKSSGTTGSISLIASKPALYLRLEEMADEAFVISYKGRQVRLTAAEIMDALEVKSPDAR